MRRDERKYKIQGTITLNNSGALPIVAAAGSLQYEGISFHYQKNKINLKEGVKEGEGRER